MVGETVSPFGALQAEQACPFVRFQGRAFVKGVPSKKTRPYPQELGVSNGQSTVHVVLEGTAWVS